MTSAPAQLGAMLGLRWQMARGRGSRVGGVLAAGVLLWLMYLALGAAQALDAPTLATAIELAPTAFLGFGALALVAPLTSSGGHEVVPPGQLVAFPVRPTTVFLGGLVLAPLNLVWQIQLLVLAVLTGCLTLDGDLARGVLTTASYVACVTVVGQALAWAVAGFRQSRAGRRAVAAAASLVLLALVASVQTGRAGDLLDASPTSSVVTAVSAQETAAWGEVTGLLLGLTGIGFLAGAALCAWALRSPGDGGAGRRGTVRRRPEAAGALRQLVAVDRASVWRAPALRRGGLVLAVLPGLTAAGAAVPWDSMIVLPGLVAAGTGLLFGVNAFSLDGPGAVWVASLPHDPALVARAKALVLGETVVGAVLLAAVAGSLRSAGSPTSSQLAAIVASGAACSAVVIAVCLRTSLRRPHRADLQGPRDAVAPPGALAWCSVRLSLPAAAIGLTTAAVASLGLWWLPVVFALPVLLGAALSLQRSLRRYADPSVRARVVQVVAAG